MSSLRTGGADYGSVGYPARSRLFIITHWKDIMGIRIQYWLSSCLAGIVLLLVIANAWFYQANVERQAEVNKRQMQIQQAVQLEGLNREILQALATFAVGKGDKQPGDKQIEQLLENLGLKVKTEAAAQPPSPVKPK